MPESPDVNALKRRGRRRLVGAVALVLVAVIVLPMVFDSEPKSPAPPVSVRIPGEDESAFSPKVTPRAESPPKTLKPAAAPEVPKTVAPPPPPVVEKPAEKPPAAATPAPSVAPEEKQRAENALADAGFVIGLGAYADEKNVRALMSRLKTEKIPAYSEPLETSKGPRTRVRAGPFLTEEAAEKARTRLLRMGVQPGPVAPRTG